MPALNTAHLPLAICLALQTAQVLADNHDTSGSSGVTPEKPPYMLEEVFVTAQKREQSLIEVPMSITAHSGEVLAQMGAEGVQDIAFATPSFSVSETGPGSQNFQIRGIASVAGRSTVGYYLDEVVLSALVSPIIQPDTNLYDLNRVEVLRGPQGTLYGEGSMGGTLRLITNAPSTREWEAELHLSYDDSPDRGDSSQAADAVLNIPMVEDTLGIRLVGSKKKSGGFIDFPELDKKNGNAGEKESSRAKFLFTPTERLDLSAMVLSHQSQADSQHVADKNFIFPGKTPQTAEDEYLIYNLSAKYAFDRMDLLVTASRFDRESLVVSDISQSVLPNLLSVDPLIDPLLKTVISDSFDEVFFIFDTEALIDVGEIRLSSSNTERWFWTAGLFVKTGYQFQDVLSEARSSSTDPAPGDPSASLIDGVQTVDTETYAVFGQVEYLVTQRLSLTAGARYFDEDLVASYEGTGFGLDATHFDKAHFTSTNPRVNVTYTFAEAGSVLEYGMVYTSWATGFRSGGANIRTTTGFDDLPPLYDPEHLTSYEIGTKMIGTEGIWSVELSLYQNQWEDIQVYQDFNGFNAITNQGRARADGVDWAFTVFPAKSLAVSLSGNYNDSVFEEDTADKQKGDRIDFVPRLSGSLGMLWKYQWSEGYPGYLRLDYNHQDGTEFRRRSDDFVFESDELRVMNIRLGLIDRPRWQLSLYGRNLLNEDGKADAISQSQVGSDYAARLRPVYYGVDIKWQLF